MFWRRCKKRNLEEKVIIGVISGKSAKGDNVDDTCISFYITPDMGCGKEEGVIFTYEAKDGYTNDPELRALNNGLNVGDKVKIIKYSDRHYSYPFKIIDKKQISTK